MNSDNTQKVVSVWVHRTLYGGCVTLCGRRHKQNKTSILKVRQWKQKQMEMGKSEGAKEREKERKTLQLNVCL